MKHEIEIQVPDVTIGRMKDFAAHFGCEAFMTRTKDHYRIETDNPVNFYTLGMNMNNGQINTLRRSSISKLIEI